MSDHPRAAASLGEQLGLSRCTGTPYCECAEHGQESSHGSSGGSPSRSRSSGGSPSRSRSRSSGEDSTWHTGAPSDEDNIAPAESESFIPDAIAETDWSGMDEIRIRRCHHGRPAILKRGWDGKYTARRFFGCPLEDRREQCMFVHWIDEPWPRPLQDSLKKLWSELRMTRRCNNTCTDALEEALRCNDIANAARLKLQEEVESTKRHAERAIISFRKQAAEVSVDKSKIMYLVYCLLGLIAFLVSALVLLLIKN